MTTLIKKQTCPTFIYEGFTPDLAYQTRLETLIELTHRRHPHFKIAVVYCSNNKAVAIVQDLREHTDNFIVWSSYYHGPIDRCSFDGFSSGTYDLTLKKAVSNAIERINN